LDELTFALGLRAGVLGSLAGKRETLLAEKVVGIMLAPGDRIRFENVTIVGDVNVRYKQVRRSAEFVHCSIGAVVADSAQFDGGLLFDRCVIGRWRASDAKFGGELLFVNGSVDDVVLHNAVFERTCYYRGTTLGRIDLSSCRALGNVRLRRLFARSLTIAGAVIGGTCDLRHLTTSALALEGARAGRLQAARCVLGAARFDHIRLENTLDLGSATIRGVLSMLNMDVRGDVNLKSCSAGFIYLSGSSVGSRLIATGANVSREFWIVSGTFGQFEGRFLRVGGRLQIEGSTFAAVYLRGAQLRGKFKFHHNTVVGEINIESERGIKPTFHRDVLLTGSVTGSDVVLADAVFKRNLTVGSLSSSGIVLKRLRIARRLVMSGTSVRLTLDILDVNVGESIYARAVSALRSTIAGIEIGGVLDLSYAKIVGAMLVRRSTARELHTRHADIGGPLSVEGSRIDRTIDFAKARFGELVIEGAEDGKGTFSDDDGSFVFPITIGMRDCQYGTLRVAWPVLLRAFGRQTKYESTGYRALEIYARSLGRADWADRIFLASQRHATRSLPRGLKRSSQVVLDLASGYGAEPIKLLRAAAVAFALMTIVLFVYGHQNPTIFGPASAMATAGLRTVAIAFDVLVAGERSGALARGAAPATAHGARLLIDVAIALRYVVLALLGLWIAYITGLVRYAGGTRA
jgi:hypothetical protein